jgi:hypothetical protein
MGANYFKIKRLPMVHQVLAMKGIHPRFQCTSKGNHAIWIGPVKPSAMSHEYQVRIVYEFGDSPKVWFFLPRLSLGVTVDEYLMFMEGLGHVFIFRIPVNGGLTVI